MRGGNGEREEVLGGGDEVCGRSGGDVGGMVGTGSG